jgi:chemotaxis response regulator CheB
MAFAIAGPTRCARGRAMSNFRCFPRRIALHMPDEITTMIVDDHEVVREGLRLSLSRAPHIRVVGEAADGASAVEMAERRKPDVIIMDVRMPGMDGLEATKILTERCSAGASSRARRATSSKRRRTRRSCARSRRSRRAMGTSIPP